MKTVQRQKFQKPLVHGIPDVSMGSIYVGLIITQTDYKDTPRTWKTEKLSNDGSL